MAKNIGDVMETLRRDVIRWKSELLRLRAQGDSSAIDKLEKTIDIAERTLFRWDNPGE